MRSFYTSLALSLAVLGFALTARAAGPEALVPGDAEVVATINVKAMLASDIYKKYGREELEKALKASEQGHTKKNHQMKRTNRKQNAVDPPKPIRATPLANEQQQLSTVVPVNISPERLRKGASTTTEVLSEILQRQTRSESVRHWGINE